MARNRGTRAGNPVVALGVLVLLSGCSGKETLYVSRMKADLVNLTQLEWSHFSQAHTYATIGPGGVAFFPQGGNTMPVIRLTPDGWTATIGNSHTNKTCAIYFGSTPIPPAVHVGYPTCQGEKPLPISLQCLNGRLDEPPPGTDSLMASMFADLCHLQDVVWRWMDQREHMRQGTPNAPTAVVCTPGATPSDVLAFCPSSGGHVEYRRTRSNLPNNFSAEDSIAFDQRDWTAILTHPRTGVRCSIATQVITCAQ